MSSPYGAAFYDTIAAGCMSSAAVVAPIVTADVRPDTVIDIGCGQGHWAAAFAELGATVLGVDGSYVEAPRVDFVARDLNSPLDDLGRFDLAVCLEVAEHLPETRADSFVDELCALAPTVLFSAAIPFQTGAGHINLQWQSWWAEKFTARGHQVSGSIRWGIWDDDRVEPWYRQNMFIASSVSGQSGTGDGPLDVVHPVIHRWGR